MDGGARAEAAEGGGAAAALGPFVKQSKMVSRGRPEAAPSSDARGTADFWDRLLQQPSYLWMEEDQEAPPLQVAFNTEKPPWRQTDRPTDGLLESPPGGRAPQGSGCAAQRPLGEEGAPWAWEAAPPLQSLPSPKELCGKKRKGPKQKGLGGLRGFSVSYHLEEVKRRQSYIDKQRAAQERGALPQLSPPGPGRAGGLPARPLSPARTPEPYARPFPGRGSRAQLLLHPQWNPGPRGPPRFPGGSPLAFYAVAAHQRSPGGGGAERRPEE